MSKRRRPDAAAPAATADNSPPPKSKTQTRAPTARDPEGEGDSVGTYPRLFSWQPLRGMRVACAGQRTRIDPVDPGGHGGAPTDGQLRFFH